MTRPVTRAPTRNRVTPAPTSTTSPAASRPRMAGRSSGSPGRFIPSRSFQSIGLMLVATTRTLSSPSCTVGSGTSRTSSWSTPPNPIRTAAFMRRSYRVLGEVLGDLPADWELDIAVDPDVHDDRPIRDGECLVELAEVIRSPHVEALRAEADRELRKVGLLKLGVARVQLLVDQVVSLLPHRVVVEHEHRERQLVAHRRVKVREVHHERSVGGHVRHAFTRPRETRAERDAQA